MGNARKVEPVHAIRLANVERLIAAQPSKKEQAAFMKRNKLQGNNIWQMRQPQGTVNWRPIGFKKAREIEDRENLPPMTLDAPLDGDAVSVPGLPQSRSKNNVLALRYALQSLFSVLHDKEQELALAVAKDIVATAGTDFAGHGFLATLVGTLRGVPQTSEAAQIEPQQPLVLRASKRVGGATKKP